MNINKIINEEINRYLNEGFFNEKESKGNTTWTYGSKSAKVANTTDNKYAETAKNAKKKGPIAQSGDEAQVVQALKDPTVNVSAVAKKAGIPQTSVSRVENGGEWGNGEDAHFRQDTLAKLQKVLGIRSNK